MGFFQEFLHRPSQTGAIAPSSERLANLITDAAMLATASVVVEFGPGTGVFTEKIIQKMPASAVFFALEINKGFVEATRRRCPGVTIYHDSVVNAGKHLEDLGYEHCDRIVCGLPWASFSEGLQDELLQTAYNVLRPGGRLVTFAYLQGLLLPAGLRFRHKLRATFSRVTQTRTEWMNLPPAFVYVAERQGPYRSPF